MAPDGEIAPLTWDHPDVRTCGHCGHQRDVHGAYRASNGGARCNLRSGCDCPGFQSIDALRYAHRAAESASREVPDV